MKLWHISDTHGTHGQLNLPEPWEADVVIHTGDATNAFLPKDNEQEFLEFVQWYATEVFCQNKIYVAGNHDTFIYNKPKVAREIFEEYGIIYLDKETIEINGVKIYGQPVSPRYGNWVFMAERGKMMKYWEGVPRDTNILATHGPRAGFLDLTENFAGGLVTAGCNALGTMLDRGGHDIKLVLHGHIHNRSNLINVGTRTYNGITYSNAATVEDGKMGIVKHHGNFLTI